MCGATGAQVQLQNEQIQFYQQMQEMTAEQYANEQAIYQPMAAQFQSIFAKGPSQQGFSAAEVNDLNKTAIEGTARGYKQAAQALNEQDAAGGGGEYLPTGAQEAAKAGMASSAAENLSNEETGIDEANWNQGYQEWLNAGSGLQAIAAGENPTGFANAATSAGSAASTTANDIATQENSWVNAAIGAVGSIGAGIATGH